jgi:hypothetical protein
MLVIFFLSHDTIKGVELPIYCIYWMKCDRTLITWNHGLLWERKILEIFFLSRDAIWGVKLHIYRRYWMGWERSLISYNKEWIFERKILVIFFITWRHLRVKLHTYRIYWMRWKKKLNTWNQRSFFERKILVIFLCHVTPSTVSYIFLNAEILVSWSHHTKWKWLQICFFSYGDFETYSFHSHKNRWKCSC